MGDERALAEQLQRDQVLATRALAALMRNELPEQVRSRVHQAVHDGTGHVELRTRIETGQTELVLVPSDSSEPLWIARTCQGCDGSNQDGFQRATTRWLILEVVAAITHLLFIECAIDRSVGVRVARRHQDSDFLDLRRVESANRNLQELWNDKVLVADFVGVRQHDDPKDSVLVDCSCGDRAPDKLRGH